MLGYVTLVVHVPWPPLVGPTPPPEHTIPLHAVLAEPAVPVYPFKHVPHVLVTVEQGFRLSEAQNEAVAPEQSMTVGLHVFPSLARV